MEDLVKQAQGLAAQGVSELILIAQDLTYYGLDLYRERKLAELESMTLREKEKEQENEEQQKREDADGQRDGGSSTDRPGKGQWSKKPFK